jgi:signal transduction histidine kinase
MLCKDFVNRHNGKIWAESKAGAGTDFIFTIPFSENTLTGER